MSGIDIFALATADHCSGLSAHLNTPNYIITPTNSHDDADYRVVGKSVGIGGRVLLSKVGNLLRESA